MRQAVALILALALMLTTIDTAPAFAVRFKDPADAGAWSVSPDHRLVVLLGAAVAYVQARGVAEVVVSSYVIGRGAGPHAEGRAIDLSVAGWPPGLGQDLADYLNAKYPTPIPQAMPSAVFERKGQVARPGGTPASGDHVHLQVAREGAGWVAWYDVMPNRFEVVA